MRPRRRSTGVPRGCSGSDHRAGNDREPPTVPIVARRGKSCSSHGLGRAVGAVVRVGTSFAGVSSTVARPEVQPGSDLVGHHPGERLRFRSTTVFSCAYRIRDGWSPTLHRPLGGRDLDRPPPPLADEFDRQRLARLLRGRGENGERLRRRLFDTDDHVVPLDSGPPSPGSRRRRESPPVPLPRRSRAAPAARRRRPHAGRGALVENVRKQFRPRRVPSFHAFSRFKRATLFTDRPCCKNGERIVRP